jgi:hypothetical protein
MNFRMAEVCIALSFERILPKPAKFHQAKMLRWECDFCQYKERASPSAFLTHLSGIAA